MLIQKSIILIKCLVLSWIWVGWCHMSRCVAGNCWPVSICVSVWVSIHLTIGLLLRHVDRCGSLIALLSRWSWWRCLSLVSLSAISGSRIAVRLEQFGCWVWSWIRTIIAHVIVVWAWWPVVAETLTRRLHIAYGCVVGVMSWRVVNFYDSRFSNKLSALVPRARVSESKMSNSSNANLVLTIGGGAGSEISLSIIFGGGVRGRSIILSINCWGCGLTMTLSTISGSGVGALSTTRWMTGGGVGARMTSLGTRTKGRSHWFLYS